MIKTEAELLEDKEVIRTETTKNANSAQRIGLMFGNIIDTLFSLITGGSIVQKLQALTGTNRLDASAIQNLPQPTAALTPVQITGQSTTDVMSQKAVTDLITAINLIIGPQGGDGDTVVNTVREMLTVFQNYQEGVDLATQLANKAEFTPIAINAAGNTHPTVQLTNVNQAIMYLLGKIGTGTTIPAEPQPVAPGVAINNDTKILTVTPVAGFPNPGDYEIEIILS